MTKLEKHLVKKLEDAHSCMLNLATIHDWNALAELDDSYEEGLEIIEDLAKLFKAIGDSQ